MTEQCKFAYAKTLQNTITETHILRIAHNIMQLNKSRPNIIKKNISEVRQKIAQKKLKQDLALFNKRPVLSENELCLRNARLTNKVGA